MSKAEGEKIAIKFTKPLVGDVSGLTPTPVGGVFQRNILKALPIVFTANSENYGAAANTNDGSLSTYWGTSATLPNWIRVDLTKSLPVNRIRLYSGASYRPRAVTFQGSNDGTTWTDIQTIECTNATGWSEITIASPTSYRYIRYYITTRWSSRTYVYEIEIYDEVPVGNEQAFTVTGQEPQYVEFPSEELGPLSNKTYEVESVAAHPTEANAVILTIKDTRGFKNIEGNLTVSYDATSGNLTGEGGSVESFSEVFAPAELVRTPNPHLNEKISAGVTDFGLTLVEAEKEFGYEPEYLDSSITDLSIVLTYTGGIDP